MRIGAIIREIRQDKGLLQSELAEMTEMSRFSISRLESADDRNVRVETLTKVAAALEVDICKLIRNSRMGENHCITGFYNISHVMEEDLE